MIRAVVLAIMITFPSAVFAQNLATGMDVNRFVGALQAHIGVEMATDCSDATEEAGTNRALCVAYLESMTALAVGAGANESRDLDYVRVKYWDPNDAEAWLGLVLAAAEIIEPEASVSDDELVVWLDTARSTGEKTSTTFGRIEITYEDDFGDHIAHIRQIGDAAEY